MRLPNPQPRYDPRAEFTRNRELEQADLRNVKTDRDTVMQGGRMVLVSPDGGKWALTVDDSGILSTEAVP